MGFVGQAEAAPTSWRILSSATVTSMPKHAENHDHPLTGGRRPSRLRRREAGQEDRCRASRVTRVGVPHHQRLSSGHRSRPAAGRPPAPARRRHRAGGADGGPRTADGRVIRGQDWLLAGHCALRQPPPRRPALPDPTAGLPRLRGFHPARRDRHAGLRRCAGARGRRPLLATGSSPPRHESLAEVSASSGRRRRDVPPRTRLHPRQHPLPADSNRSSDASLPAVRAERPTTAAGAAAGSRPHSPATVRTECQDGTRSGRRCHDPRRSPLPAARPGRVEGRKPARRASDTQRATVLRAM